MNVTPRAARLAALALVVSGGLLVASCAGGSVQTAPVPGAPTAPLVQSVPTSGGSLTVNSPSSQFATLRFAAGAPAGVSLTASSSGTAPGGAPAPSSFKRTAESITGAVPFFYVLASVSAPLPLQYLAGATIALAPLQPANASFYVELDDITTSNAPTKLGTIGPATVSGGVATFTTDSSGGSPTLAAGKSYMLQFYYIPAGTATPSPAPSATATSSASPGTGTGTTIYTLGDTISQHTFAPNCQTISQPGGYTPCSNSMITFPTDTTNATLYFTPPSVSTEVTIESTTLTSKIVPKNPPFPAYTGAGTLLFYLGLFANPQADFPKTPSIGYDFPGGTTTFTSCILYAYVSSGSNTFAWTQIVPATGSTPVSTFNGNKSIGIPGTALGSGTVTLSPAGSYAAIVCT